MNLPFFIARRYLFAPKSHNVINIISAISAIGMAIGTAALIIILSVYNGFDSIIKKNLSDIAPDILITPVSGKVFTADDAFFDRIMDHPEVTSACSYLQENVFVNYDGRQELALARGVGNDYAELTKLKDHVKQGTFSLIHGEMPLCSVGSGFAYKMGINPGFVAKLEVYYPDRTKNVSLSNPASTIRNVRLHPSSILALNSELDNSLVLMPIEQMRSLLKYNEEVSAIEVRLAGDLSRKSYNAVIKSIRQDMGECFKISDRYQQNESLYKMMKYEKAAIFLILIFIIIIIAFNIFGSLSMLIIEKKSDIGTLRSMGAEHKLIRKIFILEGWMISLLGLACGLAVGLAFAFAQQHWGIIKMPGNYLISSYPVIIQWGDILATVSGVALIGYLIALLPVASYCKK